jgi:hypothetical protein
VAGFDLGSGRFCQEPTICDFSCNDVLRPSSGTMEVPMTMRSEHHATDSEDAAFDATMKIVVLGLLVIAGMALWYVYA